MKRSSNDYGQIQVTWQAAFVLIALFFLGLTVVVWLLTSSDADTRQRDSDWFEIAVVTFFDLIVFGLGALGMWSRLHKLTNPGDRSRTVVQIRNGVCIILGAIIVTVVSQRYFSFEAFGEYWYILPGGLYLWGMAVIANAMNPQLDGMDR
jgi:hypothetical protein